MNKEILGEIEMKDGRLFLINLRKGREISRIDVTSVWHFCKEVLEHKKLTTSN